MKNCLTTNCYKRIYMPISSWKLPKYTWANKVILSNRSTKHYSVRRWTNRRRNQRDNRYINLWLRNESYKQLPVVYPTCRLRFSFLLCIVWPKQTAEFIYSVQYLGDTFLVFTRRTVCNFEGWFSNLHTPRPEFPDEMVFLTIQYANMLTKLLMPQNTVRSCCSFDPCMQFYAIRNFKGNAT